MGNSSSVPGIDKALQIVTLSKKNGKKKSEVNKRTSHSHKKAKLDTKSALIDEGEAGDILELLQELKTIEKGQELLQEYINYQTGKSNKKPRLLLETSVITDDIPMDIFVNSAA